MADFAVSVDDIDALLPQTQCRRCGYAGCEPYARAIAAGTADINRCPPGGDATIITLAALTGRRALPLAQECGVAPQLQIAVIDESHCIGCTLCIGACPLDAVIGGAKRMHAVVASLCSGCELCLPACPVDCIALVPAGRTWTHDDASAARERYRARNTRLALGRRIAERKPAPVGSTVHDDAASVQRRAAVAAALARARARRSGT